MSRFGVFQRPVREQREKAQRLRAFFTEQNLQTIGNARAALREQARLLERALGERLDAVETLENALRQESLPERLGEVRAAAEQIDQTYRNRFHEKHEQRRTKYDEAIKRLRGSDICRVLPENEAEQALRQLSLRAVEKCDLPPFRAADLDSGATLETLVQDLELLPSLEAGAAAELARLAKSAGDPEQPVVQVRLSDFLPRSRPLSDFSVEEIDTAVERLKQKLLGLRELGQKVIWE